MSRKTMNVEVLKDKINTMLATSTCPHDRRQGSMNVLEEVLHCTGNYRGFRFLLESEVPAGQKPGIIYADVDGTMLPHPDYEKRFDKSTTDSTRVYYY